MNKVAILILTYLIFPKLVENLFRFFRGFIIYLMFVNLITIIILGMYSYLYDIIALIYNKIE